MPLIRRWPFWVSQQVIDDRKAAMEDLERASGDLADTMAKVVRSERVNSRMRNARYRNGFSESMETLFAAKGTETPHQPRGT